MNNSLNNTVLAIYAKAPILGEVKSRLARSIGDAAALHAHVELVEHTLARLADVKGFDKQLWLSQSHDKAVQWRERYDCRMCLQETGDLGQRMHATFAHLFNNGAHAVVLIGSDCPGIDEQYLAQAHQALENVPAVLGPTEDGGYGLIGLTASQFQSLKVVFKDISWGTSDVFRQTCTRLEQAGCSWLALERIWDVDTESDWKRYQDEFGVRK